VTVGRAAAMPDSDMSNPNPINRRHFLQTTGQSILAAGTLSALPAVRGAKAPSETIGIGQIGIGTRGGDLLNAGKDIYCEKGFAHTLAEAKLMRHALKQSKVVFNWAIRRGRSPRRCRRRN
jgi:hypothetical protein